MLGACSGTATAYKAYLGELRQDLQLAVLEGTSFVRRDLINRYVDTVRFFSIDDIPIENSQDHQSVQIAPGFHDVRVYFSWDTGSQRGLAPALVDYAANRETMSRVLTFNARAGESYRIRAQPYFNDQRKDITTLSHVDFWVVDGQGKEIVARDKGRYIPSR